jgi:predicted ATPase
VAAQLAGKFGDGVWYVDLAPLTDPELVSVTVARALGLPDQPGRSTIAERLASAHPDNPDYQRDLSRGRSAAADLDLSSN